MPCGLRNYNSPGTRRDPIGERVSQGGLSLPKMLSGANAFEISDIERMNIGAHPPGV